MKQIVLIFSLIAAVLCNAGTLNLADSAEKYYENSEFVKAISAYERLIASGKTSFQLHYNLANAYFKNNQVGQALLHYEHARKLNPTDEDLNFNIAIAESKVVDKIKARHVLIENEIRDFFIYKLNTTGWAWLSIAAFALTLALVFFYFVAGSPGRRRLFFWTSLLSMLLFFSSMLFGYMAVSQKNSKSNGVIISSSVNVYNSPREEENNKKSYTLNDGTRVRILSSENEWTNIQLANGNEGWVRSSLLGVY